MPKSTHSDDLEGSYALCFKTHAPWCSHYSFTFNLLLESEWPQRMFNLVI